MSKKILHVGLDIGSTTIKTVVLDAGSSYTLADYPITLPTTDCNFFLAEMYIPNNVTITMKVADATNADNYFILKITMAEGVLTMTYQKAGGEESSAYTSDAVAFATDVASGGSLVDMFTGYTIQIVYNGASANVGRFNNPDSLRDLQGFTAENVIITFSSDVAAEIGIRYFGDTLDWRVA